MDPGAEQVRLRHRQTSKMVYLFCTVVRSPPSPTICPPNKTPNPITTMVKLSSLSLFRMEVAYTMASSPAMAPFSCTSMVPLSFYGASTRDAKGRPSCTSTSSGPHDTHCPTSSIWMSGGGTPNSSASLDSRSYPSQKRSSSSSTAESAVTSAQAARRPYIHLSGSGLKTFARHPELGSGSQSLGKRDWLERGNRGECKAAKGHVPPGHGNVPATLPPLLPQPTLGSHGLGACSGQA